MRYRRFGKTELPLSVFSLGVMRCLASPEMALATIYRALELGINHLETAQAYGASETYLGQFFRSFPQRQQVYLTTKIIPQGDADTMERLIDQSLGRLECGYLDTLAVHGLNTQEHLDWLHRGGMTGVQRAVADGRVRHVGFSTHGPLEVVLAAINTGLFSFVNLHYYLFFQRLAPALDVAQAQDLGVFIISPADKGGLLYTPPEQLEQLCAPLSPLHLNYRFLLADSRITTLSLGPANPEELAWPLAVADQEGPLTLEEVGILNRLRRQQELALGSDLCRQCYQCLPCPEGIHIPEVLRLRNLTVAYDMVPYGKYRYGMLGKAGHWVPGRPGDQCTDCGDCLPRCPEKLAIPALLRDTHRRLQGQEVKRLWGNKTM